jgi:oligoendopeptidase F
VDAFQHWVYTHPHHTPEERAQAWTNVMDRFEGDVEWTGYERVRRLLWHKQLHIFLNAFYYIEYGIAQMGALRVWANYREDKASAAQSYKKALKLGNTVSLPELFAAAGCPFSFGRETLRPLIQLIQAELENLASERKEALV